jgi:DNA-directed RNA polymerase specialized sigma24 family protein
MELTFSAFADDLLEGPAAPASGSSPEADVLAREVEHGCTLALLPCLDRPSRLAYVFGEVFEVTSSEGAWICEISEAAYRKRVSRARGAVRTRRWRQ